jgi:uncharacterized membrane protein
MLKFDTYELIHLTGIFFVLVAVGSVALHAANGGLKVTSTTRRLVAITHGIGMFVILLGGFGLLARLGIQQGGGFPGWVWVKLGIWVLLGALIAVPYRWPAAARAIWLLVPVLGVIAGFFAIFKPI